MLLKLEEILQERSGPTHQRNRHDNNHDIDNKCNQARDKTAVLAIDIKALESNLIDVCAFLRQIESLSAHRLPLVLAS